MTERKKYDSTVARIAGNILSGWSPHHDGDTDEMAVKWAVSLARKIVEETIRTQLVLPGAD